MSSWLYDKKVRHILYQVLCLGVVLGLAAFFINTAAFKLENQGITSGFGFLGDRSGFSVSQSLIPYSEDSSYGRVFWVGLVNTIIMSGLGIIFATLLGFLVAIGRLSSNYLLSKIATFYVETLRNIPLLLQIFFWYFVVLRSLPEVRESLAWREQFFLNNRGIYMPAVVSEEGSLMVILLALLAVPALWLGLYLLKRRHQLTGKFFPRWPLYVFAVLWLPVMVVFMGVPFHIEIPTPSTFNIEGGLVLLPEFMALLLSLSLYTASFIAEIVRAGILAVPRGQVEAARALGLSYGVTLNKIVIPQAMRVIIPPLTSQYLNLTKNSSLGAAIGYPELVTVFAGTVLNQTGQAVEVLIITMGVYLFLSLCLSGFMNYYNKKSLLIEK